MKLTALIPMEAVPIFGLRPVMTQLTIGAGEYPDWRVAVRGPSVLVISPAGWTTGKPPHEWTHTQRTIVEIPRSRCTLRWVFDDGEKIDVTNYTPPKETFCATCRRQLPEGDTCDRCSKETR